MIRNFEDYNKYLKADAAAHGIKLNTFKRQVFHLLFDELWQFHRLLRKHELLRNSPKNFVTKLFATYIHYRFKKHSIKLGFSIPANVLGPGIFLPHYGSIIINTNARVGQNCLIHANVVIGANGGSAKAPKIGNNVFIGPGAKIFGDIEIADNIYIGANSVVNKSLIETNGIYAGIPAKLIRKEKSVWWEKNRLRLTTTDIF